ncbi:hypothetical protein EDC01DRAFT_13822 [Geopyxis carbonaria]|nr:hypothetical protein EDC01DRAFT_13822 [Geopyxis carbonaria]
MFGSLRYLGSLFPRHSLQQRLSPLRSSNPAPCFTSLYSQFRTMFSRAVKSYDSTRPAPKATSPPPKPTTQASLMNAFGHKPAPKLTLSRESKVFKQSSVGGNIVPPRHSVVETALTSVDGVPITRKRSFGQRDIATEFNNSSSFQENSPPPVETCAPTGTAAVPTSVYFDEADFEDDNDLDFDITDTAIDATIVKAAASIPSPKLSQPKPQNQAPTFHGQIMPAPQHSNQQETAPVEVEPASKKRRTLPWPTNSEEPIHSINSKVTSKSNPRKTYEDGLPWNTMAADALGAKDTKRAARQQNRALNTTAGDSQQQAKAKKSRSRPAAVFLSDEQKHVITVAEAGKSVFFTGAVPENQFFFGS